MEVPRRSNGEIIAIVQQKDNGRFAPVQAVERGNTRKCTVPFTGTYSDEAL